MFVLEGVVKAGLKNGVVSILGWMESQGMKDHGLVVLEY